MLDLILQGGQGNQMFEYATALAVSEELGVKVRLDLSFFDAFGKKGWCRPFGLDIFRLDSDAVYTHRYSLPVRVLPRLNVKCRQRGIQHLGPCWFELDRMEDIRGRKSILMYGYFNNVHVFDPHAEAIRRAFEFKTVPDEANRAVMDRMASCESVAVHIRRGDYLNAANSAFAKNGVDWYGRAMKEMEARVGNPRWFFFSDDMEWVKKTFGEIQNAEFVDLNRGKESYNDMRLMAACRHNIIANSTFSWWAAWLNRNPDKVVVSPHDYYAEPEDNRKKYLDRMIPEGWTVLE